MYVYPKKKNCHIAIERNVSKNKNKNKNKKEKKERKKVSNR